MKLSVATNWDIELIEGLEDAPVHDFFAALPSNIVGGGRPAFILAPATSKTVEEYVRLVHAKGRKFTYLLNAPCLNNLEYDAKTHGELLSHIDWINSIGVDYVTVSIPYLLELIVRQFPQLKTKVSVIAHASSVQRVKFWEDLGAEIITVDPMINRSFGLLEKIKNATACRLEVLLNDACLYQCPYIYYHYNICGHASQNHNPLQGFYIDYCIIRCTMDLLSDPAQVLKSRWVRPEDIAAYEDLGIDYFKISGRRMSTRWLLNAVKAYAARTWEGNLVDILNFIVPGVDPDTHSGQYHTYVTRPEFIEKERLIKLAQAHPVKPYLDNKSLHGFLDFFRKVDCASSCGSCTHCADWAKKAVRYPEQDFARYLNALRELHQDLVTSKAFCESAKLEKTAVGESPLDWGATVREKFQEVIQAVPSEFSEIARHFVEKRSCENARDRGSAIIEEEDLVRAFLSETPAVFKVEMLSKLNDLGIPVEKYES